MTKEGSVRAPFFAAGRAPYPLPCVHARCRAFTSAGAVAAWGERCTDIEVLVGCAREQTTARKETH